jgi:predicted transcriptional regulator of viral defense system
VAAKKTARKPAVKAKATKKTVAKKKVTKKAPAKKKAAALTATDQVLKVIKRYKKGVGVPAIKEKTGLGDKTVRNILARAFKLKKIKRAGRGLYVGA